MDLPLCQAVAVHRDEDGMLRTFACELVAGHDGDHTNCQGAFWVIWSAITAFSQFPPATPGGHPTTKVSK